MKFTDSTQCQSFLHCKTCRDTTTVGKLWRAVVAKNYEVSGPQWDCPHGWKWGGEPGMKLRMKQWLGIGSKFKKTTTAVGIKPCAGCRRRAQRMDGRRA